MIAITKVRLGVSVAMALAVAGLVTASSLPASGETPAGPTPVDVQVGTLTLDLPVGPNPRAGSAVFTPDSQRLPGVDPVTQTLRVEQPCRVQPGFAPTADPQLLVIGGRVNSTDAWVQYTQRGLGVHPSGGTQPCGDSAGQIGPNEWLSFALGDFFSDGLVEGLYIKKAELQIARRQQADGNLMVGFNNGTATQVQPPVPVVPGDVGAKVTVTNGATAAPFRSIALGTTATNNSRGLSVVGPVTFELWAPSTIDFEVDCGDEVPQTEGGEIATKVVFLRGENQLKNAEDPGDAEDQVNGEDQDNGDGNDEVAGECTKIQVTIAIVNDPDSPDEVTDFVFWNNTNEVDGKAVNATVTVTWAPIDPKWAGRPTGIDYDGYGPGGYIDTPWCVSFTEKEENGQVFYDAVLPPYPGGLGAAGPGANKDGTAPWCLIRSDQYQEGDKVYRTEILFGSGDPKLTTSTAR
jgi:hypothetical protein